MNQLENEPSLYLQQHATNPVEWYPWGNKALEKAIAENKPILLSIGYSSCHWCHVMAHESFEDEITASVMNENFINIKVDREERPDIDQIYQTAHQLLTRRNGGWPLTMFLDPQTQLPFFGGTYFPPAPRFNLPGFRDLLMRISSTYQDNKTDLETQSKKLSEMLARLNERAEVRGIDDRTLLSAARDQLASRYDPIHGGFGPAPKFPMPANIERLLRHWAFSRRHDAVDREAFDMALTTLTRIARGGIYDHVGGGFCRYSTDNEWMIPHFEKMLYDNGRLMSLFADALGLGPDPLFESALGKRLIGSFATCNIHKVVILPLWTRIQTESKGATTYGVETKFRTFWIATNTSLSKRCTVWIKRRILRANGIFIAEMLGAPSPKG